MFLHLYFILSSVWEYDYPKRFEHYKYNIPGLFVYPVKNDRDGFHVGMKHRKKLGYTQTLGHIGTSNNSIYIDIGARNPESSFSEFKKNYPNGQNFYTFAFEADPKFKNMYKSIANLTYIEKAVATKDGNCYFTQKSSLTSHLSYEKTKENSLEVQCIDIKKWLDENIPHSALTVAKIDIEKTEFEVIPYLLKYPNTFRRIDELYLECHHVETWGHRPHTFKECLKMFKDIRKIGIIVHEWF